MYNVFFSPSAVDNTCDKCGSGLYQRDDDTEETISKRLEVYKIKTAPLMDYFRTKGILKRVSGDGSIDEIFSRVKAAMDLE